MKFFGTMMLLAGLVLGGVAFAADTQPATTTKAATAPACCGDACKKMGTCCKVDAAGKTTCPMGGGCCTKPAK